MLKRLLLAAAIVLVIPLVASAQLGNVRGWCEDGQQPVVTAGLTSTTLVQASFPQCTVTVFVHGGGGRSDGDEQRLGVLVQQRADAFELHGRD